ncbi:hypothetical protein SHIRM173S_09167 [Streptomyces hirsutus]
MLRTGIRASRMRPRAASTSARRCGRTAARASVSSKLLDAEAQPGGAARGEDLQPVGGDRGRRGLHGQGDGAQIGAHAVFGDVAQPLEFGGGEEGGGAAAEGRRGEAQAVLLAQGLPHGARLPVQGVQVGAGEAVRGADAGEEVAEAAADLAERDVEIEGEGVLGFGGPQVTQERAVGELPVGGLVRVGVDVALVGARRVCAGDVGVRAGGGGHRAASAGVWPRRKWA